eukprot:9878543-Heterocapsa_arctica.AAC.1
MSVINNNRPSLEKNKQNKMFLRTMRSLDQRKKVHKLRDCAARQKKEETMKPGRRLKEEKEDGIRIT